jgi:hypothetical protein
MHGSVLISSDPARFLDCLRGIADLGFDEIYVHHVGQQQRDFVEWFGEHVLPGLHE